jgi:hypothetical protein
MLEHNPPGDADKLAWLHGGAILSGRVSANLEYIMEGKVRAGQETTFALLNLATSKANLDVPEEPSGRVVCRDTGEDLGAYSDVADLGRWIVGVAQFASEQAGLAKLNKPSTQKRRAAAKRLKQELAHTYG